jgi:hypothetical protein
MTKIVEVNNHRYLFSFDIKRGKAVNGRFRASDGAKLIEDLLETHGGHRKLGELIDEICASIKLYHVTINETKTVDYTSELYGTSIEDAKNEAMTGNGDCVIEHEVNTDFEVVDCVQVDEEAEYAEEDEDETDNVNDAR